MSELSLLIGNKAYSSWSLRGWLACRLSGLPFREETINLYDDAGKARLAQASPTGLVPVLRHGEVLVWESLAIAEYLAELAPAAGLWPADRAARAHARAISAEMHAGFGELRRAMWMNVRRRFPGKGRTPGALAGIARIEALWRDTRARFGAGGPFLFGRPCAADAMYAPVVTRFVTWDPPLAGDSRAYMDTIMAWPAMREWIDAARVEPWTASQYENPGD